MSPEEEQFYLQWEKDRIVPHFKRKPFLRASLLSLALIPAGFKYFLAVLC